MTTCDRQAGFTLIEVIVVLAVMGLLLGTAVPLAGAVVQADKRQEARNELAAIGHALDSYYYQHGAFPASLRATDFFGVHLQPGVADTGVVDAFGGNQDYLYATAGNPDVATVHSRGEDGIDSGVLNEEHVIRVYGAVAGARRTRLLLRMAAEVLANHIESGGSTSGTWPTVRAACGLGNEYDADGFGTTLQWVDTTCELSSAGPDRSFGTADDIKL